MLSEGKPTMRNGDGLVINPEAEQEVLSGPANSPSVSGQDEAKSFEKYRLEHEILKEKNKLDHERDLNSQNLGHLGKFFGASQGAASNIAGITVGVSFVLLAGNIFWLNDEKTTSYLIGLIGSGLSFLFGSATKK